MVETDNILAYTRESTTKRFSGHLAGSTEALVVVACEAALGDQARDALVRSMETLGWTGALTWLFVDAPTPLSKAELYEAIEGLDPVIVVLVGCETAALAGGAYACDVPVQGRFRLFGRDACTFDDLEALLQSGEGKQKAWGLLKTLPHAP